MISFAVKPRHGLSSHQKVVRWVSPPEMMRQKLGKKDQTQYENETKEKAFNELGHDRDISKSQNDQAMCYVGRWFVRDVRYVKEVVMLEAVNVS